MSSPRAFGDDDGGAAAALASPSEEEGEEEEGEEEAAAAPPSPLVVVPPPPTSTAQNSSSSSTSGGENIRKRRLGLFVASAALAHPGKAHYGGEDAWFCSPSSGTIGEVFEECRSRPFFVSLLSLLFDEKRKKAQKVFSHHATK